MQCGIGFGKEKGVVSEVGNAGSFGVGSCVEKNLGNFGKWEHGLRLVRRKQMGGMNGAIARYHRLRSSPVSQMVFPGVNREQDDEVVCESLVMSALRRSVEV